MAIPVVNANSVNPNKTPRSVVSDLGMHCLPITLRDFRLKRVNLTVLKFEQVYLII